MAKRTTEADIVKILKATYVEYVKDEDLMYWRYHMNMKGYSTTALCNWVAKNIPKINDMVLKLDDLQESRLYNELIKKSGKVNTTGGIFVLKSKHNAIEYEKELQLEQQNKQLDLDRDINIRFIKDDDE